MSITNEDKTLSLSQFNDVKNLNAITLIAKRPDGIKNEFIGITKDNSLYYFKIELDDYDIISKTFVSARFPTEKNALESFSAQLIRAIWGESYAADLRLIPIDLFSFHCIQKDSSKTHQTTLEQYNLSSIEEETFTNNVLSSHPIISPYQAGLKPSESVIHLDKPFKKMIELTTIGLLLGISDLKITNTICCPNNIIQLADCEASFEVKQSSNEMLGVAPYTKFNTLIHTQEGRRVIDTFLQCKDSILEDLLKQYDWCLSEETINNIRSKFKKLKQLPEFKLPLKDTSNPKIDKQMYLMAKIMGLVGSLESLLDTINNESRKYVINNLDIYDDRFNWIKNQISSLLEVHSEIIENNLCDMFQNLLSSSHQSALSFCDQFENNRNEALNKNASNNKSMLDNVLSNLKTISPEELQLLCNSETTYLRFILKKPASSLPVDVERIAIYMINPLDANNTKNIFEITHKNHGKRFYSQVKNTNVLGISLGNNAIIDSSNKKHAQVLDAHKWSNLNYYNNETQKKYEKIHTRISREVQHLVKSITHPVEILFIGCGQGHEINETLNFLKKNTIPHVIYGIDRDACNIKTARKKYATENTVYFVEGDAHDIDTHIKALRKKADIQHSDSKTTITVSSGFLTRLVVTPQYAYKIFQKIASMSDHIFIAGKTETLILRRDAKNCGMGITQKLNCEDGEIHELTHYDFIALDQQVNKLLDNYKLDGTTLNMKGQARAIALIKYINQNHPDVFEKPIIIQLQEAYIDSESLNYLTELLDEKKLIQIACYKEDEWHKQLPKDKIMLVKSYNEPLKNKNGFFDAERRPAFSEGFMARISPKI